MEKNVVKILPEKEIVLRVYVPNEFASEFSGSFEKEFPGNYRKEFDNTRVTFDHFESKTSRWVMKVILDEIKEKSFHDFLNKFAIKWKLDYSPENN